jgi:phosphatidylglycerophosphatase A
MGIATFSVCYILSLLFAVWICGRCGEILKETDPPAVNLDEYIAMPLCFWPVEHFLGPMPLPLWAFLLLGFALFRLFDIRKPPPIGLLQKLPGGWGIVLDDSAAALATALCLWLAVAFLGLPSAHLAIGGG